jgi:hypothetical protein
VRRIKTIYRFIQLSTSLLYTYYLSGNSQLYTIRNHYSIPALQTLSYFLFSPCDSKEEYYGSKIGGQFLSLVHLPTAGCRSTIKCNDYCLFEGWISVMIVGRYTTERNTHPSGKIAAPVSSDFQRRLVTQADHTRESPSLSWKHRFSQSTLYTRGSRKRDPYAPLVSLSGSCRG